MKASQLFNNFYLLLQLSRTTFKKKMCYKYRYIKHINVLTSVKESKKIFNLHLIKLKILGLTLRKRAMF